MPKFTYNRPNQKWVCGRACDGKPCALGPTPKGDCTVRSECTPLKNGDRFECTRAPQFGGKCEQGPLPNGDCCLQIPPCTPKRSVRSLRYLVSLFMVSISLGVIAFFMGRGGDQATMFYSPGPLNSQHSTVEHQCSACHSQVQGAAHEWLRKGPDAQHLSQNCRNCHKMGEHWNQAHALDPKELADITFAKHEGKTNLRITKQLECALCHVEHQGADFDLKHMTKQQCQTCHSERFDSFANGHPEFEQFPFERRTRISFDHASHFAKHFEKQKKKVSCQDCHQLSLDKHFMNVRGFKQSCFECHGGQIKGVDQVTKAITFVRLPALDLETLAKSKIGIGGWPEDADGEMTPFMKLLFQNDSELKEQLAQLEDFDFSDLSEMSRPEQVFVAKIAWKIKEFMNSLVTEGVDVVESRLMRDEEAKSKFNLSSLLGGLPVEVLRESIKSWFPRLKQEIALKKQGKFVLTKVLPSPEKTNNDEEWMRAGGWFKSTDEYTLKYRPYGHADEFLHSWLDLSAKKAGVEGVEKDLFTNLTDRQESPGMCTKCHTVDNASDGSMIVNWKAKESDPSIRGFVRFNHESHLSLIGEEGCFTCHPMEEKAQYDKYVSGYDPSKFESNFKAINKETCASCHQKNRVGDSCVSCHFYHIGKSPSARELFQEIKTHY